jgi:hypothetical protein
MSNCFINGVFVTGKNPLVKSEEPLKVQKPGAALISIRPKQTGKIRANPSRERVSLRIEVSSKSELPLSRMRLFIVSYAASFYCFVTPRLFIVSYAASFYCFVRRAGGPGSYQCTK